MDRVKVVENENYDPNAPGFSVYDEVRIFLRGGRVLESPQVRHALGNARRPLGIDDLERKFMDCLATGNPALDARRLFRDLQRLESLPSCRLLVGAPVRAAAA